ncbi:MAG: MATE family efflux transporter [Acutalibacter sp.]|nr:MATE family efflux transporter [Acutalibacter sp.]
MKLPHRQKGSYEINMTEGALLGKLIQFSIPLALSGILQLLFNAADIVVVGRFAGSHALAAVGSTGALNMLIINLFMGLSIGVNVLCARFYGAGQERDLSETVHTAILVAALSGVVLIGLGISLSRPLLQMMDTPADVIDHSVLYMRIIFAGMPASMLYNFGSAVLRAVGDTQRPLYFLMTAGIINVLLNLFFVIVLHMGVAGVALATILSQTVSAVLVLVCLMRCEGAYRLDVKRLKIYGPKLRDMARIGIPAGIQSSMFSISNVLIQSTVNSFGSVAMAGSTAAGNIEGFLFTTLDAFTQGCQSFVGQNYGAKKLDRVRKIVWMCVVLCTAIGAVLGVTAYLCGKSLLGIYSSDPEVIAYGMQRMAINSALYFTFAPMNIFSGAMRGLGNSLLPMADSILGTCVLRVAWVYTVFALFPSWQMLFISYPASWALTGLLAGISYVFVKKKAVERLEQYRPRPQEAE